MSRSDKCREVTIVFKDGEKLSYYVKESLYGATASDQVSNQFKSRIVQFSNRGTVITPTTNSNILYVIIGKQQEIQYYHGLD
ncbi:MAG: hypothetical protein H9W80_16570 [Enterococcus sp.]|nr:hypothetical protein [Enterococcus sp.]QOC57443.1 hypothetical protein phi9181_ORF073 [Enterococcus phage 9181]